MSEYRKHLFMPDTHVPDHNVKAVNNLIQFIADWEPDEVTNLGDFLDMKGPARWSKGLAAEYQSSVAAEADAGVKIFGMIREVFSGPFNYLEGNHEARLRNYLHKYAPALRDLPGLTLESLLELDALDIVLQRQPFRFAPGWVAVHGGPLAPMGGASAMKVVKKIGLNVVQGHTHRLARITDTTDKPRMGIECGNLMDLRKADYLEFNAANWQSGFMYAYVKGGQVHPVLVDVAPNGSFVVEGQEYAA